MADTTRHWEHRDEPALEDVPLQPAVRERASTRLREDVLAKTDFDPATLWQWGTMQAMALVGVLEAAEAKFGAEGQKMVGEAVSAIGLDVGRQILASTRDPRRHDARPSSSRSTRR